MRLPEQLAQIVAQKRHHYIRELSLYDDDRLFCDVMFEALRISARAQRPYMAYVQTLSPISAERLQAYSDGRKNPSAYLAHAALDAVMEKGYTPDQPDEMMLMVGTLLTRSDVKRPEDINRYFPGHWSDEYRQRLIGLAESMVKGELRDDMVAVQTQKESGGKSDS